MGDSQEDLYLQIVSRYSVEFGGLGGDISEVTLTREAYEDLGRPEVIRVTVAPIFEDADDYE